MSARGRRPPRLVLFFTRGVSLRTWDEVGMLEREVAVYRRLREQGVEVAFVTYGDEGDRDYARALDGIAVLPLGGTGRLRRDLAKLLLAHGPALLRADVFKTNQLPGAALAAWAKRLLRRRLIVRCGYPYSQNARAKAEGAVEAEQALAMERFAFGEADAVVMTTEASRRYVLETHPALPPEKVRVVPNYVVTDVFRPMPEVEKRFDLAIVARASAEKNLDALLEALAELRARGRDASIVLLGGCGEDAGLRRRARGLGVAATFEGAVPNFELPFWLNSARAFILPSLFEGHPKALLEAMGCGLPCVGTDVRGIRELIRHGATGWLCGTSAEEIAAAVDAVLGDAALRERLGRAARDYVEGHFGLDAIARRELALVREVMG